MNQQIQTALCVLLDQQRKKNPHAELYVVGGCVRDLLLSSITSPTKRECKRFVNGAADVDFVVEEGCHAWVESLAKILGGGAVVPLSDIEGERAARFVWHGEQLDFADWRSGALSLEEDLWRRDFSINAMALPFFSYIHDNCEELIDPANGKEDLKIGRIRHLGKAFADDPLRMLRAYRFYAKYGFSIAQETQIAIVENAWKIEQVAVERISYELRQIFDSPRTSQTIEEMENLALLQYILPELQRGKGVDQPKEFHHLDVLHHNFLALKMVEKIIESPEKFCTNSHILSRLNTYFTQEGSARRLKWAALLHDIGKSVTKRFDRDKKRITFHGHDNQGVKLFEKYAKRNRWGCEERQQVALLIALHMHPFHLLTARRNGSLSKKGILRFCRRANNELYGLFLLALSDVLAGNPKFHKQMSQELLLFFDWVDQVYREEIEPITTTSPLITGRDLIALGFTPSGLFRQIFIAVEEGQVEGTIGNREMAIDFICNKFSSLQNSGKGDAAYSCE